MNRRAFLTGVGGVVLGLPFLESLTRAADASLPRYAFFMRTANGVQQADGNEPERFWPHELGSLAGGVLSGRDGDRAVSELSAYAEQLLLVRGSRLPFAPTTCGHAQGGNQILTAATINGESTHRTLAMGESIDNRIARSFSNNGGEPLTLYTGPRTGYLEEVLSYRGPEQLRSAEDDPWNAYERMVGVGAGGLDTLLEDRRRSVNDLVREQMQSLLSRDLSRADRDRLDLHFQSIRDFEQAACRLSEDEEQAMASLLGLGTLNDNRVTVAQMHMDLVALAFSCDHVRAATLQLGDGNDSTEYTIGGQRLPRFHYISHRVYSDGSDGDPIPDADLLHHQIDRLHAQIFLRLVERLDAYGILDQCVAAWTSDLGAGVSHTYQNIPWVIAGSGGGTLRMGQYVDAGGVPHAQVLSTIGSAVGVCNDAGEPLDDFGHPSLETGRVSEMLV